jgi:GPI ethanolamine phosphate transferase 1
MFKEGAIPGRVDAECYSSEAEDFTQDATHLDTWVFQKVEELFASAATNKTLHQQLNKDKNVFFLHLLGLDTTGHAYRPYSKEYLHNIKIVDEGVEKITKLIEKFYDDGKTAFVFTADHGMSDWGSHGDGHPDNTRTPLIAWGSGVAKPVLLSTEGDEKLAPGHEDGFSSDWNLDNVQRNDVAQADVATLMAYLAGLEMPTNSVGELPLAYVGGDLKEKAEGSLANAREILEMYSVKGEQKAVHAIKYRPFPPLGPGEHSVEHRTAEIQQLIHDEKYDEAIIKCQELMKLGLEGLRYLQTYDWALLRTVVTAGYLGYVALSLSVVIDFYVLPGEIKPSRSPTSSIFFLSVGVAIFSVLLVQRSPWTYYAYTVFPVAFWEEVYARRHSIYRGGSVLLAHIQTPADWATFGLKSVALIGLLEALVRCVPTPR